MSTKFGCYRELYQLFNNQLSVNSIQISFLGSTIIGKIYLKSYVVAQAHMDMKTRGKDLLEYYTEDFQVLKKCIQTPCNFDLQ